MGSRGCFMVTVMFPGFSDGVGSCLLPCLKMSHPVSCWLFESHGFLIMSHDVS